MLLCDEGGVFAGMLVGINVIDCNFNLKGHDLDSLVIIYLIIIHIKKVPFSFGIFYNLCEKILLASIQNEIYLILLQNINVCVGLNRFTNFKSYSWYGKKL